MGLTQLIQTQAIGDVMLLEICSSMSSLADHSILNELDEIRLQRKAIGCHKLVVDLAAAPFFGSSLLELIRILWNDITPGGGKIVFCNPSTVGREVLEVAKFDQIWPILDSREAALAAFSVGCHVDNWTQPLRELLSKYEQGAETLRQAVEGFSSIQLRTPATPGSWSVLQVVCHIADFELVYADRMKRVVAEEKPTMFGGDPDVFAAKLAYGQRDLEEELAMISSVRKTVSRFLKTLSPEDFQRTGIHSEDGAISLARLLERIAGHIPHHIQFINGKARTMRITESGGLRV